LQPEKFKMDFKPDVSGPRPHFSKENSQRCAVKLAHTASPVKPDFEQIVCRHIGARRPSLK